MTVNTKLIVVSAAWCKQCGILKEALTKAGVVYNVIDADTEDGMQFCRENSVRGLPTSFVYEGGELVKTIVGVKPVKEYV